jgi:hypothetical protein
VVVTLALLAGCSSSADGDDTASTGAGDTSPSASPATSDDSDDSGADSATAAGSGDATPRADAVPPAPEPPRFAPGPAGQRAYAEFVMAAWSWALVSNDARPLVDQSAFKARACDGCRPFARDLRTRSREGWYVDFDGLEVRSTELRRSGDRITATSRVAIPASDTFFEDGGYRSSNEPRDRARFVVVMEKRAKAYRLVSFTLS